VYCKLTFKRCHADLLAWKARYVRGREEKEIGIEGISRGDSNVIELTEQLQEMGCQYAVLAKSGY
jgi:hypothetical protein